MKFLCDQCKAKYQIADDKVAGKTVRMKCRKCGHLIEVRAAVTETSVAGSAPPDSSDTGAPRRASAPPAPVPGMRPAPAKPPPPRGAPMATSLSAAKPPPPRPLTKPEPPAGLAAAFKSSVQQPKSDDDDAQKDLLELSSADEWYCAINGVPVGPVRASELRRKASQGAVTEESLVWQEGFEEWRVLRTVPELASLVREAQAGGRVSLVTPGTPEPPGAMRASTPPPAGYGRPPPPRTGGPSRSPEAPRAATTARNNVVPITSRLATAERLDDVPIDEAPLEHGAVAADPFGTGTSPMNGPGAVTSTRVSAAPPAAALAAPSSLSLPPSAPGERRGSPPWIVYAMLVLAAAFGVTAAIAVFFRPAPAAAPAPAPVVIQVPTPAATVAAPAPEPDAIELEATTSAAAKPGAPKSNAAAKPSVSAVARPIDPGIASLLNGGLASGPSSGGTGGAGPSGSSLTTDQVEGVVRNHSLGVRRTCWERGAPNSPSANIAVSVTVGPSGQVSNASATGNDPVVAKCIEGDVRSWRFPPTGSTTTVNIPFHFVRQ